MTVLNLLLAIPAGLLIGTSLGTLGAGGSTLTIPVLVYLLGQNPQQAATISLILVGISSLAGVAAHYRAGRVRLGAGVSFGVLGAAGSYFGTRLASTVDQQLLMLAFAGLLIVAGAAMLLRQRRRSSPSTDGETPTDRHGPAQDPDPPGGGDGAPNPPGSGVATLARPTVQARAAVAPRALASRLNARTVAKTLTAASVVGLLTGFFGVGGGFVAVPALVLALGFETPIAVGTSLVVIVLNSITALIPRLGAHAASLNWPLIGVFAVAAILGVLLGNRVAGRVAPAKLSRAFATVLILIAGYIALTTLAMA